MESKKNDRQGKKDTKGKVRMELLPMEALRSVAEILTFGAEKYGANNWQNIDDGYNLFWGALLRHKTLKDMGEEFDKESGKPHDAHIACNALFMLYYSLQKQKELKEKPPYKVCGLCDMIINKEQEYDICCSTLWSDDLYIFDMNVARKSKASILALKISNRIVELVNINFTSFVNFEKANEKQKEFYISVMNFLDIK